MKPGVLPGFFKLKSLIINNMKTLSKVKKENPEFKELIQNVIEALGSEDSTSDVNRSGADAGYPGFTYYVDTHEFTTNNRQDIKKLIDYMADQLGEDAYEMIKGFRCLDKEPETLQEIHVFLGGGKMEQSNVTNALAWFALEEVCRMFEN